MSIQSRDRAEARRRARLAARGELPEDEEVADGPEGAPAGKPRGGFLSRLFPPAPPLPGRPDPLAGFDASGPLRPVRERIYLLRTNLWTWLGLGVLAFIGFVASLFWRGGVLELVATFFMFGALIAAGWFGWQRPTLFGTTTAIFGYVLATVFILLQFASVGVDLGEATSPATIATTLLRDGLYQAALGFLGGWYGGYLRRRQTQLAIETRGLRRR
jgi:hypothetical protein